MRSVFVMFDLDGTLTDPYEGITRCVVHAFAQLGRPTPSSQSLRGFVGPPLQDAFADWLPAAEIEDAIAVYRTRFNDAGWRENRVYDGIPELLDDLSRGGNRLAVVTSKPAVFAERILLHFDLRDHFERVVGATLDGRTRHKHDLIRLALSDAHTTSAQAVMIGDRAQDVAGAKANNVRAIGVRWGYADPGELETAGADAIVNQPSELVGVADL